MASYDYLGGSANHLGRLSDGTPDYFIQFERQYSPRNPWSCSPPYQHGSPSANFTDYPGEPQEVNFDEWLVGDMDGLDVASVPGLSSDTSEERGVSPSSPISGSPRATLRTLQQHDDNLTVPRQEHRKIAPDYPASIQFYNLHDSPPDYWDDQREGYWPSGVSYVAGTTGSSSGSSRSSSQRPKSDRGKRTKPLLDKDAVAEVRDRGACLHCRIRKVKCDLQAVCEQCYKRASKVKGASSNLLCEHICIRNTLSEIGPVFKRTCAAPKRKIGEPVQYLQWYIYFDDITVDQLPLQICVQEHFSRESAQFLLARHVVRNLDDEMVNWATNQLFRERCQGYPGFQGALDDFMQPCMNALKRCMAALSPKSSSYQSAAFQEKLLWKVYQFRCMYRIWSGESFACQDASGNRIYLEAESVYTELRDVARSAMSTLEPDILSMLDKFLKPKSMASWERLPVWVCMMELILTYRKVYHTIDAQALAAYTLPPEYGRFRSISKRLMMALSVMSDAHFKKQMPERSERPESSEKTGPIDWQKYNPELDSIFEQRDLHFNCPTEQPGPLDCLLKELLVQPHQSKRKRRRVAA